MYKGKTILALIPARGGSKGIKYKNIRVVGGKPLIAWTIEEAKKSKYIDRIVVSSEDKKILAVAAKFGGGVPFIRPKDLSRDSTPGIAPVLHALNALPEKYDFIVLLQPTSPLRISNDIDAAIKRCLSSKSQSCVSVTEPEKSPYWMFVVNKTQRLEKLLTGQTPDRRQSLPKIYAVNGAVYVAACDWLLRSKTFIGARTVAYKMPPERSLDIDSLLDLYKMKAYLAYQKRLSGVSPHRYSSK